MILQSTFTADDLYLDSRCDLPHIPVLQAAWDRLNSDRYYRHYFGEIDCSFTDGVLTLQGRVPTFHLKQILQTSLRGINGVERIDNFVEVCGGSQLINRPR